MLNYRNTTRKVHSYGITNFEDGRIEEHDMQQCCHCGYHFKVVPGSGRVRGFCLKCMQVTCGKPACNTCLPIEKWLDGVENGIIIP